MTLYEINEQIKYAVDLGFNAETGEILDSSALEALQIARDEKIENICLYIKDLNAEAKALGDEAKALSERKAKAERKAESLKTYLQKMMHGEKFKSSKCSLSYRITQAVKITDEAAIPKKYLRIKTEPNKTAIKEMLTAGKKVRGAVLEDHENMILK